MNKIGWSKKFCRFVVGVSLALACGQGLSAATGDWAQWRGPKRDNISTETGLLKDWPKEGPPLLWETKELGGKTSGYSSVAVADGKIITMGPFPNAPAAAPAEEKKEPVKEEKKDDKK